MAVSNLASFTERMLAASEVADVTRLAGLQAIRGILINGGDSSLPVMYWIEKDGVTGVEKCLMTKYGKESAEEFINAGRPRSAAVAHGVNYAKARGVELLDAKGLKDLWRLYVSKLTGKVILYTKVNGNSQFEINVYLAILMHLPHFYEAFCDYLLDMDDGLEIAVEAEFQGGMEDPQERVWRLYKDNAGANNVPYVVGDSVKTASDWEYIPFCLIFSMGKAVNVPDAERSTRFHTI